MDAVSISSTSIDVLQHWLRRRASMGEAETLLALLRADEEPEVSVRGTDGDLLVVTTARILLLREGDVDRAIHQNAVAQVTVDADGLGARICLYSEHGAPLCITVPSDQFGEALDALEAVQLGMPTRPVHSAPAASAPS